MVQAKKGGMRMETGNCIDVPMVALKRLRDILTPNEIHIVNVGRMTLESDDEFHAGKCVYISAVLSIPAPSDDQKQIIG